MPRSFGLLVLGKPNAARNYNLVGLIRTGENTFSLDPQPSSNTTKYTTQPSLSIQHTDCLPVTKNQFKTLILFIIPGYIRILFARLL